MNDEQQIERLKQMAEDAKNAALSDLEKKFSREIKALKNAPAVSIKLPPLMAFAIITQIQLASRHPANDFWCRGQAIFAAKQLEDIFEPDSAIALALEMGWDETNDRPIKRKREGEIIAEAVALEDLSQEERQSVAYLQDVVKQIARDFGEDETEPDEGCEIL